MNISNDSLQLSTNVLVKQLETLLLTKEQELFFRIKKLANKLQKSITKKFMKGKVDLYFQEKKLGCLPGREAINKQTQ